MVVATAERPAVTVCARLMGVGVLVTLAALHADDLGHDGGRVDNVDFTISALEKGVAFRRRGGCGSSDAGSRNADRGNT